MLKDEVNKALEVVRKGGVILYPTDTIWGIGCDATNEAAVRRVFEIKRRADSKAMISLVDNPNRLARYVRDIPDVAWDMMELAMTPLTIIYDDVMGLAPGMIAEDGSAAFRVTKEEFSHELCFRLQKPLVSTSANISGEQTARTFKEISDEIKNAVDYVVHYSQQGKEKHQPSRIVKIGKNCEVKVIR